MNCFRPSFIYLSLAFTVSTAVLSLEASGQPAGKAEGVLPPAASGATATDNRIDSWINKATGKVVKQLGGIIPDNLKDRVQKELTKKLTGENRQKILQRLESKIPGKIKEKLPESMLTEIPDIKITRIEHVNYSSETDNPAHQMNIYLPPMKGIKFPLIFFIHGGGWQSRPSAPPQWVDSFVKQGYAVACVNYRLSSEGIFPAQSEDLNTALRFLKQNAAKINVDPERIGVFGESAGGHLAALMGSSWDSAAMDLGGDKSVSRKISAVCDFYGPTDLYALGTKPYPGNKWDLTSPTAPLSLLLGGPAASKKALCDAASPVNYVSPSTPPFLIMHGTSDDVIPVSQSREFADALKKHGIDVTLIEVPGAGHGFEDKASLETVSNFFNKYLHPVKS